MMIILVSTSDGAYCLLLYTEPISLKVPCNLFGIVRRYLAAGGLDSQG